MSQNIEKTDNSANDGFELGFARGRIFGELEHTPLRRTVNIGSPDFCSTRNPDRDHNTEKYEGADSHNREHSNTDLSSLITQLAQQIGQSISDQLKKGSEKNEYPNNQPQSMGKSQVLIESPSLNLTGMKLVMKPDVKAPPCFRGDGSDKLTVHEWEELMDVYLKKKGVPLAEQADEIMANLMGRAKDIIRITLRSNPSLQPKRDPKVVTDILKQHFSDLTYSSMPLADFYGTLPAPGETAMEYWIRLNKAVDIADECLRRQGRNIEDPNREVTMMFVKYCPDHSLSAILKFKTADKWTAAEIQERLDEYQAEKRAQMKAQSNRSAFATTLAANAQASILDDGMSGNEPKVSAGQSGLPLTPSVQTSDSCTQSLINFLDRVLKQNMQAPSVPVDSYRHENAGRKFCKVCRATNHSTVAHCRREGLCLFCFEHGHRKRECPNWSSQHSPEVNYSSQGAGPLNH